ncbi:MAG: TRAP transporter substrate-binding protein [Deltaproteobacteria bacterium]|nr:TRAP transporter substrate-binding protein [Deltaproteobacteria bacterium]
MKRRDFLGKVIVGATTATLAGVATACGDGASQGDAVSAPVVAKKKVTWRLASSFPRSLDTIFGGAEVLAERVTAMSGGAFTIKTHPAGELVPGLEVMDAVQGGAVQVGHTASYYYTGKSKALAFDCTVPFGLTARQQSAWLLEGGGLELMREVFAPFGILNFPAGNTGVQMGGWFKKKIESLADLEGLKMRIPGFGGKVMDRLGATVQVLAGGDIFPALERGAIDATEWVGPYDDLSLGFYKVAKVYHYPGWWEPGPSLSYYVNKSAWDKLPKEFQEIFTAAAAESAVAMQTRYDARNPTALEEIKKHGVELAPFSADVMAAARRESEALLEEFAAEDATFKKVYDAWKPFRDRQFDWFSVAELAYAQAVSG